MIPVVNDKACEQVVKATAMVVISGIVYAGIWAMFFRGLYAHSK
jgi:hypothetical protein